MILPKGNRSKIDNKIGSYILKNYPQMSSYQIGKNLGIHGATVAQFLNLNHIQIMPLGYFIVGKSPLNKKLPNLKTLKYEYLILKNKITQIAKKYKCTDGAVYAELRRHNVIKRPRIHKWNKKTIEIEALKYKSKMEFRDKSNTAYKTAHKLGIIDKVCFHMMSQGTLYKRFVYIYQFSDNSVYVGITLNKIKRHSQHIRFGICKNRTILKYKVSKLLPAQDALVLEQKMVDLFKDNNYNVLNKAKCTSLGSVCLIWTKDKVLKVAKLCKTKNEFWIKYNSAANSAKRQGFYKDVTLHMSPNAKYKKIRKISCGRIFNSISDAAKFNKIPYYNIVNSLRRKTKTWEYVK